VESLLLLLPSSVFPGVFVFLFLGPLFASLVFPLSLSAAESYSNKKKRMEVAYGCLRLLAETSRRDPVKELASAHSL